MLCHKPFWGVLVLGGQGRKNPGDQRMETPRFLHKIKLALESETTYVDVVHGTRLEPSDNITHPSITVEERVLKDV